MQYAHILLVEDNEGDILLTLEALEERKFVRQLSIVKNGRDAIDFLFQNNHYTSVERPDLILLDINLPKKNGLEVLQIIKSDKKTKTIPVIILTTSSSPADITKAYFHQANCYISKPTDLDGFLTMIGTLENYWFNLAQLPQPLHKI